MDRRQFVQASLSSLAAAGLLREVPAWGQTGLVRRDVTTQAAGQDLKDYAAAAAAMQAIKVPTDPLSWEYWARIHNDHCPHTNWWFLPWHRAYLYYFEQVCQTILKKPSFRLPYWNWSANNNIPQPFLDTSSSLYHKRASTTVSQEAVNQQLIDRLVRSPSELDMFSGEAGTQRGSGRTGLLEGTPHNTVHNNIGDIMATLFSPRDPIFWLHHCNIDRIWASWQKIPGHNSPSRPQWGQLALASFYDSVNRRQVSPVTSTVPSGQYSIPYDRYVVVQNAQLKRSLQFREFGLAGAAAFEAVPGREIGGVAESVKPVALGSGETVSIHLAGLQKFAPQSFRAEAAPAAAAGASVSESYLLIEDVPWPSDPNVSLRVFLNAEHPTPATPVTDPSYVGTISFFGMPMKNTFALDLTEALARRLSAGSTTVEVGLVAVDLLHPERVSSEAVIRPAALRIVALSEKL